MSISTRNSSVKYLTGEQFAAWIKTRDLTVNDAAELLGVQHSTVRWYIKNGVSKTHALAISAIEKCLSPWEPTVDELARSLTMSIPTKDKRKE